MYNYSQALTFTFFLPGPLTLVEEPGTLAWESLFQMKIYRWIKMKKQVSRMLLVLQNQNCKRMSDRVTY